MGTNFVQAALQNGIEIRAVLSGQATSVLIDDTARGMFILLQCSILYMLKAALAFYEHLQKS